MRSDVGENSVYKVGQLAVWNFEASISLDPLYSIFAVVAYYGMLIHAMQLCLVLTKLLVESNLKISRSFRCYRIELL